MFLTLFLLLHNIESISLLGFNLGVYLSSALKVKRRFEERILLSEASELSLDSDNGSWSDQKRFSLYLHDKVFHILLHKSFLAPFFLAEASPFF